MLSLKYILIKIKLKGYMKINIDKNKAKRKAERIGFYLLLIAVIAGALYVWLSVQLDELISTASHQDVKQGAITKVIKSLK